MYLILLERSDNSTCSVPGFMTFSLPQIADAAGYTLSATKEALAHLERHGWLIRTRGGGRGHKSSYKLAAGRPCDAASPADCLRPRKQSDPSAPLSQKQADPSARKQADMPSQNGRSDRELHEGINEGEKWEGAAVADWRRWPPGSIGEYANRRRT